MKQFCLLFLVLFAAQIFADVSYVTRGAFTSQEFQPTFSLESSDDYEEPPIRIPGNTFTGTYSFSKRANFGNGPELRTYVCVDKYNQLFGSYGEAGIIQAFVTADDENGTLAEGFFYEAGTGACTWGEIQLLLTTYGFKGVYNCQGEGDDYEFEEVLLNQYRPSDDQCALLDLAGNDTLDGEWKDRNGHPMDICVTEQRWQMSYLREPDNAQGPLPNTLVEGYAIGTTFVQGKVLSGTWYEEDAAGAIIILYRDDGRLQYWRWTGLLGNQGRTVIDLSQFYNENLHRSVYYPGKTGNATPKECHRFNIVKDYVLATLRQDDGDYYYFLEDDFFTTEYYNIYYTSATTVYVNSNDAVGLFVSSLLLVVVALLI